MIGQMARPRARRSGEFSERVREIIGNLRLGEVTTYGEVAEEAGSPGGARAVGNVLARSESLPWWRVVTHAGRLAPGHEADQERRLRSEGVEIVNGRVRHRAGGADRSRLWG